MAFVNGIPADDADGLVAELRELGFDDGEILSVILAALTVGRPIDTAP